MALNEIQGAELAHPVEANAVFVRLPDATIARLREAGARFYDWPPPEGGQHADPAGPVLRHAGTRCRQASSTSQENKPRRNLEIGPPIPISKVPGGNSARRTKRPGSQGAGPTHKAQRRL